MDCLGKLFTGSYHWESGVRLNLKKLELFDSQKVLWCLFTLRVVILWAVVVVCTIVERVPEGSRVSLGLGFKLCGCLESGLKVADQFHVCSMSQYLNGILGPLGSKFLQIMSLKM